MADQPQAAREAAATPALAAVPAARPEAADVASLQAVVAVLQASPLVVFLWRLAEGWPVDFVSEGVRQFGFTPEDFTSGRVSWVGVTHPEDVPRLEAEVTAHRQAGITSFAQEYRLICPSGETRWVDDHTMQVCDAQGRHTHYAGVIRDITARKRVEQALRESEAQLALALEVGGLGIWEWDLATNTSRVNARECELFGLPPAEGPVDTARFFARVHPADLEDLRRRVGEAVARGSAVTTEVRVVMADGTVRWVAGHGRIERDASGRVSSLRGVNYDITARKQGEEALRESEERLRLALAGGDMGLWEWDIVADYGVYSERQFELLGLEPTADGRTRTEDFYRQVHPEDLARVRSRIEDALQGSDAFAEEFRVRLADGTVRWLVGKGQLMRDREGRPLRMTGVNYDITARKQAEDAVRESEERLRLALESGGMGLWEWDFLTGRVRITARQYLLAGLAPSVGEEVESSYFFEHVHPDDLGPLRASIRASLEEGVPYVAEFRIRHPDGSYRWLAGSGRVIRDTGGCPLRMIGVNYDIGARKQVEEALRVSETQYRTLAEAARDMIFVIGRDDRVQYVNGFAARQFGCAPADLIGRDRASLFPEPESGRQRDNLWKVLDLGQPLYREERTPLSGRQLWLGTWLVPLFDDAARVRAVLGVARDITARREAEDSLAALNAELEGRVEARTAELRRTLADLEEAQDALRSREAQYRGLAENTRDILFAVDAAGVVRFIGPQTTRYGWEPQEIIGHSLLEFVHEEDGERVMREFASIMGGGPVKTVELRVRRRNQAPVWFEEIATPQHAADGRVISLTGVLRDITERKDAEQLRAVQEQRLRELAMRLDNARDEEQRRLADWLHDDIAQLLAACSYRLAELRKPATPEGLDASARDIAAILAEAQQKVRRLSRELASSTLYRLGLSEALEELCQGMLERHGVRFTFSDDGRRKPLERETGAVLLRAARELMFNVVKHAGVAMASVRLYRDATQVCVEVEDHGRGFPVAPGPDGMVSGDGLGLFSVHERLHGIGGDLRIDTRPGERTRVTVCAPLATGRHQSASSTPV